MTNPDISLVKAAILYLLSIFFH